MNNCNGCAYAKNIPGDCHISCRFNWTKAFPNIQQPQYEQRAVNNGWYNFPYNYDPTWQRSACPARAEKVDPEFTVNGSLFDILSILNFAR